MKSVATAKKGEIDARWTSIFEVLSDKTRLCMFKKLINEDGLCTTELSRAFGTSLPIASYHLKLLEMKGLVGKKRSGQMICYHVRNDDPFVRKVVKLLT